MKEKIRALRNMSSSSRSTAYVQPRRVEPPPITANGAQIRSGVGVLISLRALADQLWGGQDGFSWNVTDWNASVRKILSLVDPCYKGIDPEEDARQLASSTVSKHGLIGCAIVQPYGDKFKQAVLLRCPRLTLSILSKSSDRIFVASKTPNLSRDVLWRKLVTFDQRIAALEEKLNEGREA